MGKHQRGVVLMFELKKLNVHRIVATEAEKVKLLAQGYVEVTQKVE
jgi:hypothetical protein